MDPAEAKEAHDALEVARKLAGEPTLGDLVGGLIGDFVKIFSQMIETKILLSAVTPFPARRRKKHKKKRRGRNRKIWKAIRSLRKARRARRGRWGNPRKKRRR